MKSGSSVALALVSLLLTGCYTSDQPALVKGDWAPLGGHFVCTAVKTKEANPQEFIEQKDEQTPPSYAYVAPNHETLLARKLADNFYLVQENPRKQPTDNDAINYMYILALSSKEFAILDVNFQSKGKYVESLARQFNVRMEIDEFGNIKLDAAPDRLQAFLVAHQNSLMKTVADCRRQ